MQTVQMGRRPYAPEDGECWTGCGKTLEDGSDQAGRQIKVCSSCAKEYALRGETAPAKAPSASPAPSRTPRTAPASSSKTVAQRAEGPSRLRQVKPCTVDGCPGTLEETGCACCKRRRDYLEALKTSCEICGGKFSPAETAGDRCEACARELEPLESGAPRARAKRRGRRPGRPKGSARKPRASRLDPHTAAVVARAKKAAKKKGGR